METAVDGAGHLMAAAEPAEPMSPLGRLEPIEPIEPASPTAQAATRHPGAKMGQVTRLGSARVLYDAHGRVQSPARGHVLLQTAVWKQRTFMYVRSRHGE